MYLLAKTKMRKIFESPLFWLLLLAVIIIYFAYFKKPSLPDKLKISNGEFEDLKAPDSITFKGQKYTYEKEETGGWFIFKRKEGDKIGLAFSKFAMRPVCTKEGIEVNSVKYNYIDEDPKWCIYQKK